MGIGAHHRAACRHGLQWRQREALVAGGLHENGRFVEQLIDLLVAGRHHVAHAVAVDHVGLDAEQAQLGAPLRLAPGAEAPPCLDREAEVLERMRAADGQHHVGPTRHLLQGTERVQVDARRYQLGVQP